MSLILEALRKSEAERRRGQAPDLLQAEAAAARTSRSGLPPWYWAGASLAVLSLFVWWQRAPAPAAPPASAISQRVVAPAPHAAQLPPVTHLRPAPPLPRTKPSPPPAVVEPTQGRRPTPPSATQGPVRLSALPATQRKALPPLQLSMHLWNQDPALRFAIIDGQRVVEGDRVGDAMVAAIRSDGVVLDWNGEQILVGLP